MSEVMQTVSENLVFVLQFLGLVVVMFLVAYGIEKAVKRKNGDSERVLATRKVVMIGVFSAIAAVLISTAFVGELANFVVACALVLPASILYLAKKTRRNAIVGTVTGTIVMTVFGTAFNAVYLIPKFAQMYGMPLDAIIAMGTAIHPSIHDVTGLVILCVAPLNLIKGGLVSLITVLIYKRLSPILKTASRRNP